VKESLSECPLIFGVKEMPASLFKKNTAYVYFSHTIKAQPYNMLMLKELISAGSHLIDYEPIKNKDGDRLLYFGRYAGIVGMVNSLWILGMKWEKDGISNPFSDLKQVLEYGGISRVREAMKRVREKILDFGFSPSLCPVLVGFAGYGHVSQGAQEFFDLLPFQEIKPEQIRHFKNDKNNTQIYKVVFKEKDMFKPKKPGASFNLQEYYDSPERYYSVFENYYPDLTLLINAIYWTPDYPKLISRDTLQHHFQHNPDFRLKVIGDITCDIEGAIECTLKNTDPGNPVFTYDPVADRISDGIKEGIAVLAVDNLPCELAAEASSHFGKVLTPMVPEIAQIDFSLSWNEQKIPNRLKNAIIVYQGKLTPYYKYLAQPVSNLSETVG
jgi:alpha-aminoadipic semialdehyde synthase